MEVFKVVELREISIIFVFDNDWNIFRVVLKNWILLKKCVIVEEMGVEIVGEIRVLSLWVCVMIWEFIVEYGVEWVCKFLGGEFCWCGFVLG